MSKKDEEARVVREAQAIVDVADGAGRRLTDAERTVIQQKLDVAADLKVGAEIEEFGRALAPTASVAGGGAGPGDVFIESEGWKGIADPGARPQRWSTGLVEVSSGQLTGPMTKAGTLLESGQGAGAIPVPQVIPGVVQKLFEQPTVANLIPSAQATTSSVRYVIEGTAVSGAAGVAEGGVKPPSDLTVSTVDEPVKKIATVLTVSDELLDDAPSVQSYMNSRLSLFVTLEEERQILRGTGTNELVGIFGRSIPVYAGGTAAGNKAVQLFKAAMGMRGTANLDASGIVLHPSDWQAIRLLTDTTGQFFGGGPFGAAYGGPQGPVNAFSGASLWGLPVVLSSTVGAGTALVGAFNSAAQVYRRGGVSVELSNSHEDYFQRDLVMARAEQREALCVYRPSAFVDVRLS